LAAAAAARLELLPAGLPPGGLRGGGPRGGWRPGAVDDLLSLLADVSSSSDMRDSAANAGSSVLPATLMSEARALCCEGARAA
jgi:hypothetical protein